MPDRGAAGRLRPALPVLSVLTAACMWGTIGTSYRLILGGVEADLIAVVTIRAVVASAVLWGWLALFDRTALRVELTDLPPIAGFGLITVTVFYLALIYAFDRTSVAVTTLLLYLAPALVTLGAAVWLGEPLTRRRLVALGTVSLGCLLVVEAYRPGNLAGNASGIGFGVVSAVSYGCYSLIGKSLLRRHAASTLLAYHLLLGAAGLLAIKLLVSPTSWPDARGIALIGGYNGLVTTLAPIALYTLGLRGMPAGEASIIATVEPVVALGLAATLLDEHLAPGQWLGALWVIAGIVLLAAPASGGRRTAPTPTRAIGGGEADG